MEGVDPESPHRQTALAVAALAVAFAKTLQEVEPDEEEVLVSLQRNLKIAYTQLRQTSDAKTAAAILGFVQAMLRNPEIIAQPVDDE
jgi:hypothetical protein